MTKPAPPAPKLQAPEEEQRTQRNLTGPNPSDQDPEFQRNTRPQRITLCAEDGRRLTLAGGAEAFICLSGHEDQQAKAALVLGLGASAGHDLADTVKDCTDILWLDAPELLAGLEKQAAALGEQEAATKGQNTEWTARIPAGWQALVGHDDASPHSVALAALSAQVAQVAQSVRGRRVYWHTQNLRLFPSFWGPILGAVQSALLGMTKAHTAATQTAATQAAHAGTGAYPLPRTVLLPGDVHSLLHRELSEAFATEGLTVRTPAMSKQCAEHCADTPNATSARPASLHDLVRAQIHEERPALFFSVNGRGLDAQGVNFALLRACGIPVALWLVDNPWHILSAWRQGWWREAHIFVTDHSFIPDLKKVGASHVHHLPLAAAQHMTPPCPQKMAEAFTLPAAHSSHVQATPRTLFHFVGRASFPTKGKFFAASRVPEQCMEHAQKLLNAIATPSVLPDFHWWTQNLAVPLWPGYEVRTAGLGAERCAALRRARWLASALPLGLTIHGDEETWRTLLPDAPLHTFQPPVDYYGALPSIYAHAPYSLNITSLLLPAGLTQRHFDVWAAGGFLLSDATRGLDIFPTELTQEIRLAGPHCLPEAVHRLERDALLRRHLQEAWQAHLATTHTYAHRVRAVLEAMTHS